MIFRVQNKIFISIALIVAGLILATVRVTNFIIDSQSSQAITEDLKNAQRVFEGLKEEREQRLISGLRVVSESPRLKAALEPSGNRKPDPSTVADLSMELKDSLRADVFQVCDKKGHLLANFLGGKLQPLNPAQPNDKAFDDIFAKAVDPEKPKASIGFQQWNGELYETITGPIIIQERVLGSMRAGFQIDAKLAKALKDQTGSEIVFTVDKNIVASSLSPQEQAELGRSLQASNLKGMNGFFEIQLARGPYLSQLSSMNDPLGSLLGYQIQLRSKENILALLLKVRQGFLLIGLSGMVIAILLSFFIARGITKPLAALVQGTRAVDEGNLNYEIKVKSRDELGQLAKSFNQMIKDLKEKERVKSLLGRYLPKAVTEKLLANRGEIMLGGEQREVSVLFSDIRGFTSMSERMPPEDIIGMLNEYFTRMVDVLLKYEGTLDKYIGDAIMAIFGAPLADEQAPTKAIKTALEMMSELQAFNKERQAKGLPLLEIGIGINTGVVVAGNLGSIKQLSYTVIGEEVNLASRLCSSAKRGQILVSEATYRKVKWQFEFNRLEPITVKNVSQPVQVYEVLGLRKESSSGSSQSVS